jgi:hypothetical protein
VFRLGDGLIAHRVLSIKLVEGKMNFMTKGDNASHTDPLVVGDTVIGRVRAIQRGDQIMSLDTVAWTLLEPALGALIFVWTRMLMLLGRRDVQERRQESSPNRTSLRGRLSRAPVRLALALVLPFCANWRAASPHQSVE